MKGGEIRTWSIVVGFRGLDSAEWHQSLSNVEERRRAFSENVRGFRG